MNYWAAFGGERKGKGKRKGKKERDGKGKEKERPVSSCSRFQSLLCLSIFFTGSNT